MRVLGICYGGGHVNTLLPVLKALEHRGDYVSCLALTTARKVVEASGIRCFGYANLMRYMPSACAGKVAAYGSRALESLGRKHSAVSAEESIAYLGWNLYELAKIESAERAWDKYEQLGRAAFHPIEPLEIMFRVEKPDIVIATNAPRSEKNSLLIAKQLGIPSVCVVDLFPFLQDWIINGEISSEICVVNEAISGYLEDLGVSPSRIHVTGNPNFAEVASLVHSKKKPKSRQAVQNILYISQPEGSVHKIKGHVDLSKSPNPALHLSTLKQVMAFTQRDSRPWRILVRAHPNESLEDLSKKASIFLGEDLVLQDPLEVSVEDSLLQADVVVAHTSTLGVISSLCGIPTIKVFGSMYDSEVPTEKLNIYAAVSQISDLSEKLEIVTKRDTIKSPKISCEAVDAAQLIIKVIDRAAQLEG